MVRSLIEKPRLLLLNEEALDFGDGIVQNFKQLEKRLKNTTIISITHRNENLHAYNKIILMDGGTVIDRGEPKQLLSDPKSFLSVYLKETDKKALKQHLAYFSIHPLENTRFDSVSRIQDLNATIKEQTGRFKEKSFSTFRQKDKETSPPKEIEKLLPPKAKNTAKKKLEELPPMRKRTNSAPHPIEVFTRESSLLLKGMCDDDNFYHHAPELTFRYLGKLGSQRTIFGNIWLSRSNERE